MNSTFPCYTGLQEACTDIPWEDLADRLTSLLGSRQAAAGALLLFANETVTQGERHLLSPILTRYGHALGSTSQNMHTAQQGEHIRYVKEIQE